MSVICAGVKAATVAADSLAISALDSGSMTRTGIAETACGDSALSQSALKADIFTVSAAVCVGVSAATAASGSRSMRDSAWCMTCATSSSLISSRWG